MKVQHYQELNENETYLYIIPNEFKDSLPVVDTISNNWEVAKKWVLKLEWDNRIRPHQKTLISDALKPRGLFLLAIFNLCERCVSCNDYFDIKTGEWYQHCVVELKNLELDSLYNPPKIYNNNYKKSLLDIDKARLATLKKFENPYQTKYLTKLIDMAISLSEKSNTFNRKYYKTFLAAYKEHIKEIESNRWGVAYIDNKGKYFNQGGRGRYGAVKHLM